MKKITLIVTIIAICFAQEAQTFNLIDGTVISGAVIEETDTELLVRTAFGEVTIPKANIIAAEYEITLKSGEKLRGTKESETDIAIVIRSSLGMLTLSKSEILDIQEVGVQTAVPVPTFYYRNRGILDYILGAPKIQTAKETVFVLGEEQLTDLFFDPTAYTFDKSTLYLSGLSFGFGITDKLQITTKWGNFFWGDMNIRPKYQVFKIGNWESQTAFAIGAHYHFRWMPNKYEWASGEFEWKNYERHWDDATETWIVDGFTTQTKHWGGFYPVGSNPVVNIEDYPTDGYFYADVDNNNDADFYEMGEIFGALTYSHARGGMRGRISHTIGGNVQAIMIDDTPQFMYRGYYGLDLDISSKLKMVGEIFYDPFYLEFWQKMEYQDYGYDNEFSDVPVEQEYVNPVHLDFGFIYAFNESFRFGMHFQQPWIAFYWKF
ncbi:hypothetical protein H8D59_00370 [bacterium]|nr:hypothetical protein [bacterium]